ncbi:hypothetical protein AOQ84DRAFT_222279 [Glonium stellatum]|uniref:Uncharacterized protein n=1 Tax=Glonium stellatum TaxID=574774 RepID=A0A8E2EZZ9_9PEZI|nr:hypothetical protein AOQ84DRAFT_222279 [Glonium stellatum]
MTSSQNPTIDASSSNDGPFYTPTSADTLLVRSFLMQLKLPTELALAIIDFADYYPVVRGHEATELHVAASTHRLNSTAVLYAVTDPIPEDTNGARVRVKNVSFELRSHDQGWGGERGCRASNFTISASAFLHLWLILPRMFYGESDPLTALHHPGTYSGSYTWFEACILRPIPSLYTDPLRLPYTFNPQPTAVCLKPVGYMLVPCSTSGREETVVWHIQSNVCADSREMVHRVEWRPGEVQDILPGRGIGKAFVEKLRPGDRVGVWARALYPGWVNHVKEVSIEVNVVVD